MSFGRLSTKGLIVSFTNKNGWSMECVIWWIWLKTIPKHTRQTLQLSTIPSSLNILRTAFLKWKNSSFSWTLKKPTWPKPNLPNWSVLRVRKTISIWYVGRTTRLTRSIFVSIEQKLQAKKPQLPVLPTILAILIAHLKYDDYLLCI